MTRRHAIPIGLIAVLLAATPAEAASTRHAKASACVAGHGHVIAADAKAQVYEVKEGEELDYRGCLFGKRRSVLLGGPVICGGGGSGCGGMTHFVLAGTTVAYETVAVENGPRESPQDEWTVVVRDLRTGRVVHSVPTGSALHSEPGYIGVGRIVALVLKSDGSAAWVAEDYERTVGVGTLQEAPYFDVWVVEKSGARQLAGGIDVDPSSLALAAGARRVGGEENNIEGTSIFWTQAGKPFSAPLN